MTATEEFNKSSNYQSPKGYPTWQIRNKYPKESTEEPEWLNVDFKQDPKAYSEAVRKYILEGNIETDFVVQHNQHRDWYHPPWLHYGANGREPINGLKYAAAIAAKYISDKQTRSLQGWLCSYFNAPAATVLHKLWEDPENPKWDKDNPVKFTRGSIIFENVFVDATENEIFTLKGAPTADACIATVGPDGKPNPSVRESTAKQLRLIQTDFAARDDRYDGVPGHIGWVFGTFIWDGTELKPGDTREKHFIPVGIEWGNDPKLTNKEFYDGKRSTECWISDEARELFKRWNAGRPWLGWHDRLNGPVDFFMSTCTSCHATAQRTPDDKPPTSLVQIPLPRDVSGKWLEDEEAFKRWFRNVPAGEPFDEGYISADFNRHVQYGWENYRHWLLTNPGA